MAAYLNYISRYAVGLFLLRTSPQDLIASRSLTWAAAWVYILSSVIVLKFSYPWSFALMYALGSALVVLLFSYTLLLARKLEARVYQTLSALFCVYILLNLVALPVVVLQSSMPSIIVLGWLNSFYGLIINTQILKEALSVSLLSAALLTLAYTIVQVFLLDLMLYLFQ